MKILLSGSNGFIGAPLFTFWQAAGHEVVRLVRGKGGEGSVGWDPVKGVLVKQDFEGFDAVVHLAGEPIASGRWTRTKKEKILYSRTVSTWLLSTLLAQTLHPPRVFISVSGVGYYGDRGDQILDESSSAGRGFLSSVCCEWEKGARAIENRGARVVHPRFGLVVGAGGAVGKMVPAFRWGLGGSLGSGQQWISWIDQEDLIRALDFALNESSLEGPVNFTSPYPVRQKEFAQTLASVLHRPCFFNLPAWFLKVIFGQMAEETLLFSARVDPKKLIDSGFFFAHSHLKDALLKAVNQFNL